ncbi:MAG: D-TA family PLP-dependent enzyme [Candidatus Poribacteria bacterium]|nr:D-TA family PLP-dependent enzyme [Candidatus Poribacteria bacterium]
MRPEYLIRDTSNVLSPSLIFYKPLIEANLQRALAMVGNDPSRLRPHVKTHKTPEIARREVELGITKHKCATLREAEMLGECGAADVMIAYQMVGPNIARLADLVARFPKTQFSSVCDDSATAELTGKQFSERGLTARLFIDLDAGMHRTGTPLGEGADALYKSFTQIKGVEPAGLHAYDGQNKSEDPKQRAALGEIVLEQVRAMRDRLLAAGCPVPRVVVGGTPSFSFYATQTDIESSPGTFVLHDGGYGEHYPDLGFVPAALLFSRVISRPSKTLACIDLGHKAISADPVGDRGQVWSVPGVTLGQQHEEHWVLELGDAETRESLKVGDGVYVCPTHVCPTVALHQEAVVVDNGEVVGSWGVTARTRSIGRRP